MKQAKGFSQTKPYSDEELYAFCYLYSLGMKVLKTINQFYEKEKNTMEITIFAKKREAKDGRKFTSYLATLTKKSGEKQTVAVKFREDCGAPDAKNCPLNIVADKKNLNMAERNYVDPETGEVRTSYTLWVSTSFRWRDTVDG